MSSKKSGPNRRRSGASKRRFGTLGFWTILTIVILLAVYVQVLAATRPNVSGQRLTVKGFNDLSEQGRLKSATILDADSYVVGRFRRADGTIGTYNMPYLKAQDSRGDLLSGLLANKVDARIDQQFTKSLAVPASLVLPALIIVVVFVYLLLAYRRGSGMFAVRSGARLASEGDSSVTFDDVAAQDDVVTELRELAQYLSDPDRFSALGARVPKGVLLYGPPGCGKTLLARALASESGASFYSITGSDFVELYVGVGAARVRDLFKEARENAPAIIFIDEIDAVGRRRKGGTASTGSGEEQSQALNQILTELDGFTAVQGTIVVGATNRPDDLDPALLRQGRFDRGIAVERPDEQGRAEILAVHARGKPLGGDVDFAAIATQGVGLTGADLGGLVNEAALLAARAHRTEILQVDLEHALERIVEAPERQRRLAMRDRSLGARSLAGERVTFADVAGIDEALAELIEVKHFLGNPTHYTEMGARFPRGFLLVGPPGCGKTLLARAVAGESNAAFISVAATEFVEIFVGEGAGRVRDLFAEARAVSPAIVFIDEIDAVGTTRQAAAGSNQEREQTLNQILVELDGFRQRDTLIVMAATNRPEILDPALVRAGRFDRTITLGLPDLAGRRAILAVHVKGKPMGPDADLDVLAAVTRGFSGADLQNLLNEATLLAARDGRREVSMDCLDRAMERIKLGIGRAYVLSDEERKVLAYHEAGHAVVTTVLREGGLPHKVSILPAGATLGRAWMANGEEQHLHSRSMLVNQMASLLGGLAAEEIALGKASSGVADDLARVARIARKMVCELGMSEAVGRLTYGSEDGTHLDGPNPGYSDDAVRLLDAEARALVVEAENLARDVLTSARASLERVAQALLERETLNAAEIRELIDRAPSVTR